MSVVPKLQRLIVKDPVMEFVLIPSGPILIRENPAESLPSVIGKTLEQHAVWSFPVRISEAEHLTNAPALVGPKTLTGRERPYRERPKRKAVGAQPASLDGEKLDIDHCLKSPG